MKMDRPKYMQVVYFCNYNSEKTILNKFTSVKDFILEKEKRK